MTDAEQAAEKLALSVWDFLSEYRNDPESLTDEHNGPERLAAARADEGLVIREIFLLRLRALPARTHRDATAYTHFRDRYRDMAKSLGYEGHMVWAESMP